MERVSVHFKWLIRGVVLVGLLGGVGFVLTGCESDDSDPAREALDSMHLDQTSLPLEMPKIAPETVSLAADGDQVVLTGSGGRGPYAWRVRDSTRGRIEVRGWSQALYTRTGPGSNSVILEDSSGHVAITHIDQAAENEITGE